MPAAISSKFLSQRRLIRGVAVVFFMGLIGVGVWIGLGHFRADALRREAQQAVQRRDHAGALLLYERYLEHRPSDGETCFHAARAARRSNDFRRAKELLDQAERLGWVSNAIVLERSLLRVQRGGLAVEQDYLHACLNGGHPDSLVILETLSMATARVFNIPVALSLIEQWATLDPTDAAPYVLKGDLEMWAGSKILAMASFAEAVRRGPDEKEARIRYGEVLLDFHRNDEALEHYEWLGRQPNPSPEVNLGLARCLLELGQTERARELLDSIVQERPNDGEALHQRGRLELLAGNYKQAEGLLRRAVERSDRPDVTLLFRMAQCLDHLGRSEEANEFRAREEALVKDLDHIKKLMRAVSASPNDPAPRCQVGQLLLQNRQATTGAGWLHTALIADPGYAPAHEALAGYYEKAGDRQKAENHARLAKQYAALKPPPVKVDPPAEPKKP